MVNSFIGLFTYPASPPIIINAGLELYICALPTCRTFFFTTATALGPIALFALISLKPLCHIFTHVLLPFICFVSFPRILAILFKMGTTVIIRFLFFFLRILMVNNNSTFSTTGLTTSIKPIMSCPVLVEFRKWQIHFADSSASFLFHKVYCTI